MFNLECMNLIVVDSIVLGYMLLYGVSMFFVYCMNVLGL